MPVLISWIDLISGDASRSSTIFKMRSSFARTIRPYPVGASTNAVKTVAALFEFCCSLIKVEIVLAFNSGVSPGMTMIVDVSDTSLVAPAAASTLVNPTIVASPVPR